MILKKILFIIFIVLFILAILLRIHLAHYPSIFVDTNHLGRIEEISSYYISLFNTNNPNHPFIKNIGYYFCPDFLYASTVGINWHPPAYHITCALLSTINYHKHIFIIKLYNLFFNLFTIYILFLLLRHLFKKDYELIFLGLNLLMFLPAHIFFSNYCTNDVLFVFLCTLFLLLSMKYDIDNRSYGIIIVLSSLCALLLLTKYTGFICFIYLNSILLFALIKKNILFKDFFKYMLILWAIVAVLAGWFYYINYRSLGNPVYMPGKSLVREHNFLSFKFIELLFSTDNSWHGSSSVLTGFYASLLVFDRIGIGMVSREIYLRNAVFCLSLFPLALIITGLVFNLTKEKYSKLNMFLLITILCIIRLLWRFKLSEGILKSSYIMFITPILSIYYAEGCRLMKGWNKNMFLSCFVFAIITDVVVIIYFYRFYMC